MFILVFSDLASHYFYSTNSEIDVIEHIHQSKNI
eukprot:UN06324